MRASGPGAGDPGDWRSRRKALALSACKQARREAVGAGAASDAPTNRIPAGGRRHDRCAARSNRTWGPGAGSRRLGRRWSTSRLMRASGSRSGSCSISL